MLSQKKIEELVKKHRNALDTLEKYESTGKVILKSRMNFTIDRNISKEFRDHCRRKNLNMSEIIEESMKRVIE